jgi:fatty acid synthase
LIFSKLFSITGPKESVRHFIAQLSANGTFVKEVPSSGAALHSRYLTDFADKFYARLRASIKSPRKRSEKWLSSTYAKINWTDAEPQFSSPEYFVKNLVSPVLFEEVTSMLPSDVITIEIGPHALLKALLKRSLREGIHVSLTQRDNLNGTNLLMSALGQLFEHGVDMNASKLYPQIEFPVSRGTAMIAPLIKWNHQESFTVPIIDRGQHYQRRNVAISLSDKNFAYIQDHIIDGRILIPGMVLLTLVWDTFRLMYGNLNSHMKIMFEDVKLTRVTILEKSQEILVCININRGSGYFEVTEKSSLLAHGFIRKANDHHPMTILPAKIDNPITLNESDFYNEMRLRGYHHQGMFRGMKEIRDDGVIGKIQWFDNWPTFFDALLQAFVLMEDTRALIVPTYIGKLVVDPEKHLDMLKAIESEEKLLDFVGDKTSKMIVVGGVEIYNFDGNETSRRREITKTVLESHKFIPNFSFSSFSKRDAAKICTQLAVEKFVASKFKCVEVNDEEHDDFMSPYMYQALKEMPGVKFSVSLLTSKNLKLENIEIEDKGLETFSEVDMVVGKNCILNENFLNSARAALKDGGFLVSHETMKLESEYKIYSGFKILGRHQMDDEFLYVLHENKSRHCAKLQKAIRITSNVCDWLEPLKSALKEGESEVIAYSQKENYSGILGLVNCIRREPLGKKLKCVFIDDDRGPKFNLENSFYSTQLDLDLPINVLKNGNWGSYRHLDMSFEQRLEPQIGNCYLRCLAKGDLSSLTWMQGSMDTESPSVIRIHYSSLNFKDLMLALGQITPNIDISRIDEQKILGVDWSGITHDGKRIMGAGTFGGLSTHIERNSKAFWEIPEAWSLEQAATVPIAYFTVYIGYFHHLNVRAGQSILIHSGAGGVGQAAIQVALAYGLVVFTTVGGEEKKNYLLGRFLHLKAENIGNSRDTTFERMVMINTNGRGVDFVLNSLSGDKLQASLRCLAKNGAFLEIGKFDMMSRTKIDMRHFAKDIAFVSMFVENFIDNPNKEVSGLNDNLLSNIFTISFALAHYRNHGRRHTKRYR